MNPENRTIHRALASIIGAPLLILRKQEKHYEQ
jgi:hypothetical protein